MNFNLNNLTDYVDNTMISGSDSKTSEEVFNYNIEKEKFDINFKKSYLRTRKWVGFFTFLLVWLWLIAILFFILSNGLGHLPCNVESKFSLSDTVLIALITTTTINVVIFLTIVIKNLFPEQK